MKSFVFPVFSEVFRNFCRKIFEKQVFIIVMVISMGMPVRKFRAGLIHATVWNNSNVKGEFKTVTFEKRYKKGDEWKSTNSLGVNDLAKAIVVLTRAFDFVALNEN
ncbi:hypothetical protein HY483_00525 [Candidatus Woesearchaeota archaeon]|nr:hypothetical protein [Candidatus Woesearchaeota archaeon]